MTTVLGYGVINKGQQIRPFLRVLFWMVYVFTLNPGKKLVACLPKHLMTGLPSL
jgi:hypothetical protein